MRRFVSIGAVACLLLWLVPAVHSEPTQLLQGTQVRLVLLNGLSTSVSRDGDPFEAVVAEPVYMGGQLLLPAGTRVRGVVARVYHRKRFNLFRGQAAMDLQFHSLELHGREVPVQMSILAIQQSSTAGSKKRRDLRTVEGEVVEAKPDIKGDLAAVGLATGGGAGVGAIFSHAVRGLVLGIVGGTTYVVVRKGRDVELPAQTALVVRVDRTVLLPALTAQSNPYSTGRQ
jgi:hypothetical protein